MLGRIFIDFSKTCRALHFSDFMLVKENRNRNWAEKVFLHFLLTNIKLRKVNNTKIMLSLRKYTKKACVSGITHYGCQKLILGTVHD